MFEIAFWKTAAKLGIPGFALALFVYLLNRTLELVPNNTAIGILTILVAGGVFGLTIYLHRPKESHTPVKASPTSPVPNAVNLVVCDTTDSPVYGLRIGIKGQDTPTEWTDETGSISIPLTKDIAPGDSVPIHIIPEPGSGKDYLIVSPWGGDIHMHSDIRPAEAFRNVIVAERGIKTALQNEGVLRAFVEYIEGRPLAAGDAASSAIQRESL
ncbi:MAG: hypothetical protein IIB38_02995, partial [Candidatus Hydrogenedentes bacterium]|nr:hypothetical protein [Candidatus Hydrogenedentota bacterium]